ncbi:hypothetical protein [Paractinoplanes hotanensis]|nr:hypothetical protein [Actinoplanes hotanensis]
MWSASRCSSAERLCQIAREKAQAGHLGVADARYDPDTGKVTLL